MNYNSQQKFFELTSAPYSDLFSGRISAASYSFSQRLAITSLMAKGRSGVLLDCAVGSGEVALACAKAGSFSKIVLNDFSPSMLKIARQRFGSIRNSDLDWHQEDCFDFLRSLPPASVDVLLCLGLVAHTGRHAELLNLLARVLAPKGVLFFQSTLSDHLGVRFHRALTSKSYTQRYGYSISYQSQKDILHSAESAGLILKSLNKFCIFLPGLDRVSRHLGYFSEFMLQPLARRFGSEGVFVFALR